MGRKKGFSFSWKRASGISAAKGKLSRKIGIPLTRSGRRQKIGRMTGCCLPLAAGLLGVLTAAAFAIDQDALTAARTEALSRLSETDAKTAGMFAAVAEIPVLGVGITEGRERQKAIRRSAWGTLDLGIMGEKGSNKSYARVDEIVDGSNFLTLDRTLWVGGVDVTGIANGEIVEITGAVFSVVGSKSYPTAIGGTNTVKYVKRLDTPEIMTAAAKLRRLNSARDWTDDTGAHTIAASFVRYENGNVVLAALDGTEKTVPMKRLSDSDQNLIRKLVRKPSAAELAKEKAKRLREAHSRLAEGPRGRGG